VRDTSELKRSLNDAALAGATPAESGQVGELGLASEPKAVRSNGHGSDSDQTFL
jgi:hypothetical protein